MKKEPTPDVEALMQQMKQSALKVASAFGMDLDYSDESVKKVESILGQIHAEYKKKTDDSGLRGIALFFAAYLGEVIRRKGLGGTWSRSHAELGEDTFPFSWSRGVLFLFAWRQKRIFDGEQDDVWFKYQACVLAKLEHS
jgi:hypothetical protein